MKTIGLPRVMNRCCKQASGVAMLMAARNKKIVGDYQHPMWLQLFGILAAAAAAWAGWVSLQGIANLWK